MSIDSKLDELFAKMGEIKAELEKSNEEISLIGMEIDDLENELKESGEQEQIEIEEVKSKWKTKRTKLTQLIAEKKEKKDTLEVGVKYSNGLMDINQALVLIMKSELIAKDKVLGCLDKLETKYEDSEFESISGGDLDLDDFRKAKEELGVLPESDEQEAEATQENVAQAS